MVSPLQTSTQRPTKEKIGGKQCIIWRHVENILTLCLVIRIACEDM